MATEGNAGFWRSDIKEQIPVILNLIIESWRTFAPPIKPKPYEPRINRKFCSHLRSHKHRSIHLFKIWSHQELLSEEGVLIGEPDILFSSYGNDEDEYFACECKVLNKTDKTGRWFSLAGEYIDGGVMRYVEERYSGGTNGGMVGYVMDGDTDKAIKCVNEAIETRKQNLGIEGKAELKKSSIRPECQQTRETRHLIGNGCFIVHHIFLPVMNRN